MGLSISYIGNKEVEGFKQKASFCEEGEGEILLLFTSHSMSWSSCFILLSTEYWVA